MILIAKTSNMHEEVKMAHMFFGETILQAKSIHRVAATSNTRTTTARRI
jgi:hypothetical protein